MMVGSWTWESAARLSGLLLAFAVLFQTWEWLQLKPTWGPRGVWRRDTLLQDYNRIPRIARAELRFVWSPRVVEAMLWLRLLACLGIAIFPLSPLCLGWIFMSTVILAGRFRGTFNGGSDSMTAWVSLGLLWVATSQNHPLVLKLGFAAISVQLTASYVVAGFVKARNPEWWTGQAFQAFLNLPGYDTAPASLAGILGHRRVAAVLGSLVILYELTFPLAWLSPSVCAVVLGLGALFHFGNFIVFGLNRFFWIWLAAYPALWALVSSRVTSAGGP